MPRYLAAAMMLAAVTTPIFSSPALAGPIEEGAAFVAANCARCHAVTAEDHSANPRAIPFRFIGRLYPIEGLEEALAEGIVVSHEMPEFVLETDEIAGLIHYLESIQVRPTY